MAALEAERWSSLSLRREPVGFSDAAAQAESAARLSSHRIEASNVSNSYLNHLF